MSRHGDGTHSDRVLATLNASIGRTVSGPALLQAMYGLTAKPPQDARGVLRVTVCKLRTQIPVNYRIVNVRGRAGAFGYRLEVVA